MGSVRVVGTGHYPALYRPTPDHRLEAARGELRPFKVTASNSYDLFELRLCIGALKIYGCEL